MKKNVASQVVGAQLNSATDGSAVTSGTTTVYLTIDGGTQSSIGTATHEGEGFWTIGPSQANTNGDHLAFTFANTSAITQTIQIYTTFPQTGDGFARLGAPAGASVSADIATVDSNVDAILVDTAEIGAAGAGLTAVPWNAAWDAEVESEVTDALNSYDPPTKTELDSGFAGLNDPTAAAIADAVLDEALSGHSTAGTLGKAVTDIETDAAAILIDTAEIGAAGAGLTAVPWNAAWDAEVESEALDALNSYDPPTKTELDSGFAGLNDPTAAAIADAVLDEALSGHTTAGTLGKAIADTETDAAAILDDTGTSGVLVSSGTGSGQLDVTSGVVQADVASISGSTTAADNLEESTEAIITGAAQTGTLSTTVMTTNLTGYADDELIGRTVIWKSGTADGQASDITDYASSSGTVTYTAIATAPADGDLFVIV